MSGGEN